MDIEAKAKYLIETFQKDKREITNIIDEIISVSKYTEANEWKEIKIEVFRLLSNEKKNLTLK
jgi:hypothetical protein